ncbi:hypothetical protein GCM10009841_01560 [Microlunatus panaciterrae]|uniref:Effector-binding domain-containing protein n=1 Tax=Microlunatus panaciterrae TaxID=400768 RepID=A0ABS2RKI9_9ACTN|nr:GyrI-like domain-containing protein [Microlunatus panaciterrae]MBM7799238.1 effector-binding domain-containing protein [Microlunatus panaciterrae]
MSYEVQIVDEPGRHLAVTRYSARPEEMGRLVGQAFGTVMAYLSSKGINPSGPAVSYYTMVGDHFDVTSGFLVDAPIEGDRTVVPLQLPAGPVATTTHIGPYQDLGKAYEALQESARQRGLLVDTAGPMWEEYWSGPETAPEQTRTTVFWPVQVAPS